MRAVGTHVLSSSFSSYTHRAPSGNIEELPGIGLSQTLLVAPATAYAADPSSAGRSVVAIVSSGGHPRGARRPWALSSA